jgi:hypothetical protein
LEVKITINTHYNGTFLEPFGERSQRGYGIEVLEQFAREVAWIEFGSDGTREQRLGAVRALAYADISADRQVVAAVQAMEAILERHVAGQPDALVRVNDRAGGLVLYAPGSSVPDVLYSAEV